MAGFGLEGEHAVGGVEDEVDLAAGVGAEEVDRGRLGLPGGPAEQFVEDGGLEEDAVGGCLIA